MRVLCCTLSIMHVCLQDTISVHRPNFYAQRFLKFMENTVFKKIPSRKLLLLPVKEVALEMLNDVKNSFLFFFFII